MVVVMVNPVVDDDATKTFVSFATGAATGVV